MIDVKPDELRPPEALRLTEARVRRGFAEAKKAATFFGWNYATYSQHERGERGLRPKIAERYARAFRVSAGWLLTGEGLRESGDVLVRGYVGAGGGVDLCDNEAPEIISDPRLAAGDVEALIVKGESMYPRFYDGEAILFDPRAVKPAELVDQYAIVQTRDGRKLIKILRRSSKVDRWRLESHNLSPEDDLVLDYAHRFLGVLPRASAAKPQGRKK